MYVETKYFKKTGMPGQARLVMEPLRDLEETGETREYGFYREAMIDAQDVEDWLVEMSIELDKWPLFLMGQVIELND